MGTDDVGDDAGGAGGETVTDDVDSYGQSGIIILVLGTGTTHAGALQVLLEDPEARGHRGRHVRAFDAPRNSSSPPRQTFKGGTIPQSQRQAGRT